MTKLTFEARNILIIKSEPKQMSPGSAGIKWIQTKDPSRAVIREPNIAIEK